MIERRIDVNGYSKTFFFHEVGSFYYPQWLFDGGEKIMEALIGFSPMTRAREFC